ncbi:hypothetical protein NP233_g9979 [Leucocoprinus birnbaumii]|uniref:Uncharacterized protein n=1 Tax=Leucocoprinus birnbaumii TaxID=56174 RepID=A0AAD5VL66_9AGAR|nr:hypothetical protein NP233_g9979 [Leucocoprinus birnbaumii]
MPRTLLARAVSDHYPLLPIPPNPSRRTTRPRDSAFHANINATQNPFPAVYRLATSPPPPWIPVSSPSTNPIWA